MNTEKIREIISKISRNITNSANKVKKSISLIKIIKINKNEEDNKNKQNVNDEDKENKENDLNKESEEDCKIVESKKIIKSKNVKNYKSKTDIKILTVHILSFCILIFFAGSAILYARGDFEIPFFEREKDDSGRIEDEPDLFARSSEITAEETAEEITNVLHVINPSDLVGSHGEISDGEESASIVAVTLPEAKTDEQYSHQINPTEETAAEVFETYSNSMKSRGFTVTDEVYEPYDEAKINQEKIRYKSETEKIKSEAAENGSEPVIPEEPALYEYKFVKITPEYRSISKSENTTVDDIKKLIVEPIMDYFIVRKFNTEILCDASGKIIDENFANSGYQILKMRDSENRTVLKKDGLYYIYDSVLNDYMNIEFDEASGNRGVPFMYPSYYGAKGSLNAYSLGNLWGYENSGTSAALIWPRFDRAFNFSEHYAIAYTNQWRQGNRLFFVNEDGQIINNTFFGPNTDADSDPVDIKDIGFYYFDHGLTRVYERQFYIWRQRVDIISERNILVNIYGNEFHIPEDYIIRGYSNGMILLEKNGYYGFMSYLGEWIAQPIFTYAEPFFEGVAVIGFKDGKKGLIDTEGNLIAKFQYDYISSCTGGIVTLYEKSAGWTVLNKIRRKISLD